MNVAAAGLEQAVTFDPPRASTRNPGIDLLRGLAILLVILLHLRIRIPLKDSLVADILPDWLVKALTDRGHEAVYVFFVISGFLITTHTLMRWRELHRIDALAFWARRAARILPCLLVLVAVLSVLHLLNVQGYTIWREGQSLSGAVVAALGFHINWYEGQYGYLPGMSAISAGVLAALIASKIQILSMAPLRVLYAVGTAGLLAAIGLTDRIAALRYVLPLLLTLSAACLILGFHWHAKLGTLRRLPGTTWLGSMGRLSYEMYLSHMFVVLSVASLVNAAQWDPYWGFVWYLPAILMAWGLGSPIERYLSMPSMKALLRERTAITNDQLARGEYVGVPRDT